MKLLDIYLTILLQIYLIILILILAKQCRNMLSNRKLLLRILEKVSGRVFGVGSGASLNNFDYLGILYEFLSIIYYTGSCSRLPHSKITP